MTRVVIALVAVTGMLLLGGCSIIDRMKGNSEKEAVPDLSETALDNVLLSEQKINEIFGGTNVRVVGTTGETLSNLSDDVSDADCVGVHYTAQEDVYRGTGWTAVRDEVLRDDGGEHFMNQTVVLFRSDDQAAKFFEDSDAQWRECVNTTLVVTGDDGDSTWNIFDLNESGPDLISMEIGLEGSPRVCRHAMGFVANVVAETIACSDNISDEAKSAVTTTISYVIREGQGA